MLGGLIDDDRLQYRTTREGFEVFPKLFTAAELLEKVKDVLHKVRDEHLEPDVAEWLRIFAVGRVRFIRGTARYRTWWEVEHRPLDRASAPCKGCLSK